MTALSTQQRFNDVRSYVGSWRQSRNVANGTNSTLLTRFGHWLPDLC